VLRRFMLLVAVVILGMCSPGLAADPGAGGGAAGPAWRDVSNELTGLGGEVRDKVERLSRTMAEERKAQAQALAGVKAEANASRARAQTLEAELRGLRDEESRLEAELESRQALMRKIENTVRDNARLFLAGAPVQPGFTLHPEWVDGLKALTAPDRFPALDEVVLLLEGLTTAIADSGRIVRGSEAIHGRDGREAQARVLRLGAVQAVYALGGETGFLVPHPGAGGLAASAYEPDPAEAGLILAALDGAATLPVDLSTGALLRNPPERATLLGTLRQGGVFLWPILLAGLVGLGLVVERFVVLRRVRLTGRAMVRAGAAAPAAAASPAQRVMARVAGDGQGGPEVMEKRLEQAVLDELPPLERFLQTIRVLAAVAPLLGLLGTVSGIIQTFRVITAYGNGDPKVLSAGISEALLTTELGLLVAIPLLLCHHFLARRVQAILLDMEVAGTALIAARCETEAR